MSYPYGANRNVKIFIGSDDPETRKEFSDLCGQKKVKNFSVNTNAESPASSNTGASNQPLITVGMLERLNGDEKGDAIVSVRGYEPIWTKFTPSYELKDVYFAAGKADIGKREARLFDKREYVFDILGGNQAKEEEKILESIERREKEEAEQEAFDKEQEAERIRKLDEEWDKVVNEIHAKVMRFCGMLDEEDAKAVQEAKLEDKELLLYAIMENYEGSINQKIQEMAKYLKTSLARLSELQAETKTNKE